MRGNRRYVMSRSSRRSNHPVPPCPDEENTLPSVDTIFLRKLIQTGDTGFIDDLVGKQSQQDDMGDDSNRSDNNNGHDGDKYHLHTNKQSRHYQQRKWPYVLLGMAIMYLFLFFWET